MRRIVPASFADKVDEAPERMISIQQNLSELEKASHAGKVAHDCYLSAIAGMAQYAVDLDVAITAPYRQYLTSLAGELVEADANALAGSRATLRGLLRDYRDRAVNYLSGLREQLSSTAQALREMVEGLSQCDSDHDRKLRGALAQLREIADSPAGNAVGLPLKAAADVIGVSLEQMQKQHKFTIAQMQTEMRLLHNRIDSLEVSAAVDETSKLSSRRFLTEYLGATAVEGVCFLILKLRGLGEARARFGAAPADEVVGSFGRRLRNTVPKEAVIGRWSEQDFLAIVPAAAKPADENLVARLAEHLSLPYACMIDGKVMRIPITVSADSLSFPAGTSADRVRARVTEAFHQ